MSRSCLLGLFFAVLLNASPVQAQTLSVDKSIYVQGSSINVFWNMPTIGQKDWIAITPRGQPFAGGAGSGKWWNTVSPTLIGSAGLTAPETDGPWDVVYYKSPDWTLPNSVEIARTQLAIGNPITCQPANSWQPPFNVIQEGGHLTVQNSHCFEFPITDVLNVVESQGSIAGSLGGRWLMPWANRCTDNCVVGNNYNLPELAIISGVLKRFQFTSVEKADACTLAQLFEAVGDLSSATKITSSKSLTPILPRDDPASKLNANGGFVDTCYLQAGATPPDTTGILLDFEVCDKRDQNRITLFAGAYAAIARAAGWKSMLYTNRLTSACGGSDNGITSLNGPFLLANFDFITIMTDDTISDTDRVADLTIQLAMLSPQKPEDYKKIVIQTQIGGMTGDGLKKTRQFVLDNNLWGVELWPNGAARSTQDSQYFQYTRCLVYGLQCPP